MQRTILFAFTAALLFAQSTSVKNEQLGGIPDGARQFFTLKHAPIKWSTQVYRNGVRQFIGRDYLEDPVRSRIGFLPGAIPEDGALLLVDYDY